MMIGNTLLVKMAEYAVTAESYCLKTTVGSCVGVVLHDPARRITGLAHIMLPNKLAGDPKIGKFADTAIPRLLRELKTLGMRQERLEVYVAGGSNMFMSCTDKRLTLIGDKNVQEVKRILEELGIPILFEDTGGGYGRTLLFDNSTGRLSIRNLKSPVEVSR